MPTPGAKPTSLELYPEGLTLLLVTLGAGWPHHPQKTLQAHGEQPQLRGYLLCDSKAQPLSSNPAGWCHWSLPSGSQVDTPRWAEHMHPMPYSQRGS